MSRWLVALCCGIALFSGAAANPAPSQVFYLPLPEDNQLSGYQAISTAAVDPLAVFVNFSASADNTVIYYDHWEDGYEEDITHPKQSTTLVFGDGNPANGYPPGNAGDLISAGTVFSLRNYVNSTTLQSVLDYDGRDKIASFKPISVTKSSFPASTNSLLAGCVEVFERGLWGTEYRAPVGVDMPTGTATSTLTWDADIFAYTALSIMAGAGGATVQIDADNNGAFEQTVTLAEGESTYVTNVNVGGHVVSDNPVQVVIFAGRPGSNYQSRDTSLLPAYRWSTSYYAPVSTISTYGTSVFLYNPGSSAITVSYDYRSSLSAYTTSTVTVPAGGNARVTLSPSNDSTNYGAYHFYTTGANPPVFYAFCAVDSASTSTSSNQAYDGGFTLVGQPSLTTQVLLSLGIGRDPYSATNPAENGNPVWITTVGNGHTLETVYVDFNGDNAGPNTDPNGNHYDVSYDLRELQQKKIYDPDGDQSGMLVYVLNPNVKIAAAWAQDPSVAAASQPGLDVATLIPPLREGDAAKGSSMVVDLNGDGYHGPGDTLEYDIRVVNTARVGINGPFTVKDDLPSDLNYEPGTAKYRFSVNGSWQAWSPIADDTSGTAFPLDGSGYGVLGTLGVGQQIQVVFRAAIKSFADLTPGAGSVKNTGSVIVTPYGITVGLEWTDKIYASIGDRVWEDLDGNGIQDPGEPGLNGITVFADLNGNGSLDSDEPSAVTAGDGNYLFGGLAAGTYTVRVDPASVAAIDPRYGPTYDVDGIDTSYVASAVLAAAQDRTDVDFGFRIGASLGDRVWMDRDGDGVQEDGEPGVNGIRVYIDSNSNGSFDSGEPNALTFGNGSYYIGNLQAGTYLVRVDTSTLPAGATQTFDLDGTATAHRATVTLLGAEHRPDLDFGYRGNQSIGDLVWEDVNGNGSQTTAVTYQIINGRVDVNGDGSANSSDDGFIGTMRIINGYADIDNDNDTNTPDSGDDGAFLGYTIINGGFDVNGSGTVSTSDDGYAAYNPEPGIAGVRVFIDANGNGTWDSTEACAVTDASGIYSITNLFNGAYAVCVDTSTLPNSLAQTYDLTSPFTDGKASVTLSGTSRTDADFGYRNDASIGDRVWNDMNNNGVQDAGEPGIENVLVYIDANTNGSFDQTTETYCMTDVNGNYLFGNLAAGTYSVRVDYSTVPRSSVATYDLDGTGTPNAASRTVAVSEDATNVDFGYRSATSVGDYVWLDLDADGVQDAGESGINGVRVFLDINGNGVFDSATEPSAVTAGNGAYSITGLTAGNYTARVDPATLPSGMIITYDLSGDLDAVAPFVLSPGETRTDVDFGFTQKVSIGDFVWNDANANGVQDPGEGGIDGVTVTVYNAAYDTIAGTTVTAEGGFYQFSSLLPGSYYVEFTKPAGFEPTLKDQGGDSSDSDADRSSGRSQTVALTSGQSNLTLDAGFYQPVSIGNFVWNDADANGIQNGGESGLNGVTVTLYRPGHGPDGVSGNADDADPVASTVSSGGGFYHFDGLPPGTYQVEFGDVAGYNHTPGNAGPDSTDSDADDSTGMTTAVAVPAGTTDDSIDAGYYQPAVISGFVLADTNNDDVGDDPISDVTLTLFTDPNGDGDPADGAVCRAPVVTLADGSYSFTNLPPGSYVVVETQPVSFRTVSDGDATVPGDDAANASISDDLIPVTVLAGETDDGNLFVEEQPGSISGTVLKDTDGDDDGDLPISGVVVRLLDGAGSPVLDGFGQPVTATTDINGNYDFIDLDPGVYRVVEEQPANYASVSDTDGPNDNVIGNFTPITVTAGSDHGGNDFIEIELGVISGHVYTDDDNNGSGDSGLGGVVLNLLDGSGDPVLDGFGAPIQVATDGAGFYQFTLVPVGSYRVSQNQPAGYASVSDVDGANNNVVGDETPIIMTPGLVVTDRDFTEVQLGAISGSVLRDVDGNGTGDGPLAGVTLALLDGSGDPVDGDPGTPGVQPVVTVTDSLGGYRFDDLLPGGYQVRETQPAGYGSVSDVDGGNPDWIGNFTTIEVNPGQEAGGRDFVETELGSISGYVLAGSSPLSGVTLTLLDEYGDPVDGDPGAPGVQPVTTVTDSNGFYQFTGVMPGVYQVGQTQPYGYDSFGDIDGGDIDIVGDVSPITLLPGQHSQNNNFIETLDTCPDDWTHWKFLHPSETPGGNPDQDAYDNFAEFAFAMPYDDGAGSPWLGATAWIIRPSSLAPGTLEGVFVRPKGAPLNTVYTLQYSAVPGNPTVWQEVVITPAVITTSDNGDCTETVTIHDLESLTGLTGGSGVTRIKADLDDDGGNDEVDHTSFSEPEGWTETPLDPCCRTYNNPYLRESVFTAAISGVSGQTLTFAASSGADLAAVLAGGGFYLEVASGENEGHRLDIISASGNTVTVANDVDLDSLSGPFNTFTGAPPADLAGDMVSIHRHRTLDDLFPPSGFGATGSQSTADQVQVYTGGSWTIFWLYDENDGNPATARWVDAADSGMADQGAIIIPPGQGAFFNNRASITSILAYGEVRDYDFIRPLAAGNNLIGGGFPVDQSAADALGRQMNPASGFFGSRDFKTADSFFVWKADALIGTTGYDTYYLLNGAPVQPALVRWVKVGDAQVLARDAETLLLGNRSVFVRSKNGLTEYRIPKPWQP